MARFLYTLFFALCSLSVFSQVHVKITDKLTGHAIPGVVLVAHQQALGISNESGVIDFSVDTFPVTVATSHLGYLPNELKISHSGEYEIVVEQSVTQLNDVVVTGQFEPQSVRQSVYKVRTISSETIQAKGATRFQDVLNTELNFRFSMDPALGVSNMTMQGLSAQNVKVLIDGVPVIGRQGTSNAVDLNQINMNSIERIEIVEGPMSTIYGADALAGVINIITKKPEQDKLSGTVRIHEENIGNEFRFFDKGIHQQSVSVAYKTNSFYSLADFSHNYAGGWQGDSTGREKQWHPKTQWIGSGTVGYQRNDWNLSYRIDFLNEDLYDPSHYTNNEALDRHYITNRFMHQVQGAATITDRLSFNGAFAFTDYSRKTQTVVVDQATGEETLAYSGQDLTEYTGVTFRGTFQYKVSEKLSLQPGYDINLESGSGGRLLEGTNKISDVAGFLSAEYKPFSFLNIRPGVRFVRNSVYQAPPVLPSINTKFILSPKYDLRISYGRGFRAPSIRELYFYFYDSNHQIEGNPDLEAELSHSINASWNWRVIKNTAWQYTTVLGGFYNSVDNLIQTAQKPSSTVTTYFNIDHYKTKGLTLDNTIKFNAVQFNAGFAYTGFYNNYQEVDDELPEFTWSPEVNASVAYTFSKIGLKANFYYKYTGNTPFYKVKSSTSEVYLSQTDDYHWADVNLQKTFLKSFSVTTGIHNLFDITQVRSTSASGTHTSGNNSLSSGRSYYLTLSFNF
ncbi:MAG: TonB-dependent receptor [Cyclobacteriaceae bacterium]